MSYKSTKKTDNASDVSFRLREERKRLGMQQQEIAEICGVSLKTVQRWEAGSPIPSDKIVALIGHGVDPQYLFTGNRLGAAVDNKLKEAVGAERVKSVLALVLNVKQSLGVKFTKEQMQTLMGYAFEHCPTVEALESFVRAAFEVAGIEIPAKSE